MEKKKKKVTNSNYQKLHLRHGIHDYLSRTLKIVFTHDQSSTIIITTHISCHLTFSSNILPNHIQIRDRIIPIISNYFEDIGARGSKRERGKDPRGDEKGTRFRLHGVQVEAELTRVSANKGDHFESVR